MGHPVLRKRARELAPDEIRSERVQRLIDDMIETMHEYQGIGLAAPQVHESLRISVIEFSQDSARYPGMGDQALVVFINPNVTVLDPTPQAFWEGCLSVPDLRGKVERPRKIRVEALDREGKPVSFVAEGFLATVFQHEFDHLDGVIYVDRVKDPRQLSFLDEFVRFHRQDDPEV